MTSVFLCDDIEELRQIVRRALESDPDLEVVGEAGDGFAGLAAIAALRPDVVLLDLAMPRMDGLEVIARLRERCPCSAIVGFSAYAAEGPVGQAFAAAVDRFVQKGAPLPSLRACLKEVAAAHKGRVRTVTRAAVE